jgi:hypothetical protein
MNKTDPFFVIKIEGPKVVSARMPLSAFMALCESFQALARRIAKVQAGYADSRTPGPAPDELERALALDIVGFTHGSPSAVVELERSASFVPCLDGLDPGLSAYMAMAEGLASDFGADEALPSGFDPGVLMGLRDLGMAFERGIARIDVSCRLEGGGRRVSGSYTPLKREAVRAAIVRPSPSLRSIDGRLVMADFGEDKHKFRIEPPFGDPISCSFDPALKDAVLENILRFVRVRGSAAPERSSGRLGTMRIVDIEPLPSAPGRAEIQARLPEEDFWRFKSLDELSKEQAVPSGLRYEDYLGGWPEDEVRDGFEDRYG